MATKKSGYIDAQRGVTKSLVGINQDGNIAQDGDTVVKSKYFSINAANADNNLAQNTKLINFFINLAGGSADSLSNKMIVTWEVA